MRTTATLLLLAAATACAVNPAPVPVDGTHADIATLAGRWEGSYLGNETGRTGGITFTLTADRDSASGDVLMDPVGQYGGSTSADAARAGDAAPSLGRFLAIRFVRLRGGEVSGTMAPYTAPDCNCRVRTTFTGRVSGDAIRGTFVTAGEGARRTTGTWEVRRRR